MKNNKNALARQFLTPGSTRQDRSASSRAVAIILMLVLLMTASVGHLLSGVARADQKNLIPVSSRFNISADLQASLTTPSAGSVKVIIETQPSITGQAVSRLLSKVSRLGGMVARRLSNDRTVAAQLPAAMISSLPAADPAPYVTVAKPTQVPGLLKPTPA